MYGRNGRCQSLRPQINPPRGHRHNFQMLRIHQQSQTRRFYATYARGGYGLLNWHWVAAGRGRVVSRIRDEGLVHKRERQDEELAVCGREVEVWS